MCFSVILSRVHSLDDANIAREQEDNSEDGIQNPRVVKGPAGQSTEHTLQRTTDVNKRFTSSPVQGSSNVHSNNSEAEQNTANRDPKDSAVSKDRMIDEIGSQDI
jgi:hypothetical protein